MDWQQYLAERNTEIYSHFDFDGFQIDQYGNGYGGASEADFSNLLGIIQANDKYSDYQRQTVFAAYINYDKADNWGSGDKMVNTPGVLLTSLFLCW